MKNIILKRLKQNLSEFVSGEALSQELNVSRTTIWKHIKELRTEGYIIESSSRTGYKLISVPDIIIPSEIISSLNTKTLGKKIHYLKEIDSTNNYAKKIAYEGCEDGTIVIAEKQTSGRGRLGRTWESSERAGIWLSVILKPDISPGAVQIITLSASVAVVKAIKAVTGIDTGIKWPNDIILDGKKVCGILTEMSSEMDKINYLVVGIGININQDKKDFPEELRDKAISIRNYTKKNKGQEVEFTRNDIIRRLLFEIEDVYNMIKAGKIENIIQSWKRHSITQGKEVVVLGRQEEFTGIAEDITPDGKLIVKSIDGITQLILSGEISIKKS